MTAVIHPADMTIRRTVVLLVLLVGSLIIFTGCPESEQAETDEVATAPFAGQTLRIAIPEGLGFPQAWAILLDEWSAQTGADYQLVEYSTESLQGALSQDGETSVVPQGFADSELLFFPILQSAELIAAEQLAPIPSSQQSEENLNWLDLYKGLRENVASAGQRPFVLPVSCPTLVCYYRRDLLEQAGLSPPETWEDYQRLLASLDRWAPGLTAVEPWNEEYRATMYLARAVSYAKHPGHYSLFFDIETGKPLIHEAGFVRALERSVEALAQMPEDVLDYSPADCRREFFSGRAALAITFETGPGRPPLPFGPTGRPAIDERAPLKEASSRVESNRAESDDPGSSEERPMQSASRPDPMRVGVVRLPGAQRIYNHSTESWQSPPNDGLNRVTLTAFSGLCAGVSSSADDKQAQAAWNLLATLAIDYLPNAFPHSAKSPCRESHNALTPLWVGQELTADEARNYLEAVTQSLRDVRLVPELSVVGRSAFRRALTEQLNRVLASEILPHAALAQVADDWTEIARTIGPQRIQDSYRRSVGLTPRSVNR